MVQIEKGMSMMSKAERSADAGDDAGQRDRQDEQERDRLAAEEVGARQRGGGERAEDQREEAWRSARDLERQTERRPDVGPVDQATANHCVV